MQNARGLNDDGSTPECGMQRQCLYGAHPRNGHSDRLNCRKQKGKAMRKCIECNGTENVILCRWFDEVMTEGDLCFFCRKGLDAILMEDDVNDDEYQSALADWKEKYPSS